MSTYHLKNVIYFPSFNSIGGVETYCNSELVTNDEVIIVGRLVGKTIKTDTGYLYYAEVRVRYINRLDQLSYGRYNES